MTKQYWEDLSDLGRALERLREVLVMPLDEHDFVRDATLKRFRFCIELCWKNLKNFIGKEEKKVGSSCDFVAQASQMGWIDDEKLWINMRQDRNILSHEYKEETADNVYAPIEIYYPAMKTALGELEVLSKV